MAHEGRKTIVGTSTIISAVLLSIIKNEIVRCLLLSIICISVWGIALNYRKGKHKNMIVKSFITVFWYVAALYITYALVMQIRSLL